MCILWLTRSHDFRKGGIAESTTKECCYAHPSKNLKLGLDMNLKSFLSFGLGVGN